MNQFISRFIFSGLYVFSLPLWAQSSESSSAPTEDLGDLESLLSEPVVSTASRYAESAQSAPATTWTITGDELRRFGVNTLAQALNFLSLGMWSEQGLDYAEAGTRGVLISGDYGAHFLVIMDGHMLNEQWDGSAYFDRVAALPLELIDRIELMLGPGSVLYGSNAMLGVIHIITKRAKDLNGVMIGVESEFISSLRTSVAAGKEITLRGSPLELLAELEFYGQQGPAQKFGPQDYGEDSVTGELRRFTRSKNGTGVWGGTIKKGRYAILPGGYLKAAWKDLTLSVRGLWTKRGNPTTTYGNFNDPKSFEQEQWWWGDLSYHANPSAMLELSARLYGDLYHYLERLPTRAAENCLEGQIEGCVYKLHGDAKWAGLELQSRLDWLTNGRLVTLLGVDSRVRRVASLENYKEWISKQNNIIQEYIHHEVAVGAYLEQTAQITSFWDINAGARLDYDQRFGVHVSPRAATAFSWPGDGTLKFIYSEAFRAPNAFESYYADPTWWVQSHDLKPEIVRSGEVVVEQKFGVHRILLGGFISQWSSLISEVSLDEDELEAARDEGLLVPSVEDASQYKNLAKMKNFGGNIGVQGSFLHHKLQYGVTTTLAKSRVYPTGKKKFERLRVSPRIFGNAHISYAHGEWWPTAALASFIMGSRLVDDSGFVPWTKAPTQWMLQATLEGPIPKVENLRYRLVGSYNLTKKTAYSVGPFASPYEGYNKQELTPYDQYRIMLGLQYLFEF